jgi:peptidase C10-like protein/FG-GAP repeat protein/CARDB protein/pre-peptidase/Calx-beta domain-containing protein
MELRELELPGLELVDPDADYSGTQTIFIDFDGAEDVSYNNDVLGIYIDNITVAHSGLSEEEQFQIITDLNTTFADTGVFFTTEFTEGTEFSTIYIGQTTTTTDGWPVMTGGFLGLSETIDVGNLIKNDAAFVFSDKLDSATTITETITHEAGHLIGFEHDNSLGTLTSIDNFAVVANLITFHTWTQSGGIYLSAGGTSLIEYNEYTPTDTGTHTVTGCVATATAQLLYYWGDIQKKNGLNITVSSIVFDNSDSYTSSALNIDIDGDAVANGFLSFNELNTKLANIEYDFDPDEIATLAFGVGVKINADYTLTDTSASIASAKNFLVEAGFSDAEIIFEFDEDGLLVSNNIDLHAEIIDDINSGMVVMLSLVDVDDGSGHAVLIDGYDAEQNLFHFNMGWGGYKDDWHSLSNLPHDYDIIDGIVYDIALNINIKPTVTVSVTDNIAGEPSNNGTYRITRTGSTSSALTVYFSMSGTATKDSDYTIGSSVTIASGATYADVNLTVINDTLFESTETAILTLNSNSGYDLGSTTSQTINITDDDAGTSIKLTASDGAEWDLFGSSVAISGDNIVIGASGDNDNGISSGSAYVYHWNGSAYDAIKLTASDGTLFGYFGYSVAVSGNNIIIGTDSDSAYLYRWNGSVYDEIKLTASGRTLYDKFGSSVAISGDNIVIGAYSTHTDHGNYSGSAYVYRWNGSAYNEIKLTASDDATDDHFGDSVAISGDNIIIGSPDDDDHGDYSGSAYVYRWNGSAYNEIKLTASDGAAGDFFGRSVAISGDNIIIGSPYDDDNGDDSGSAYVYRWNGSVYDEIKLTASDGAADDRFGYSVATDGDNIVIGAHYDDDNGDSSGSAYLYHWNGTAYDETKLVALDSATDDFFGYSVAISDDNIVIGAYHDDDNGDDSGSAYIYKLSDIIDIEKPTVTVSITDSNAGEPSNDGTYRITRTGSTSSSLTVYFSMSGTATKDSDYTIGSSVTIASGATYADINLTVINDTLLESTESAILTLNSNSGYDLGSTTSQTINITDDDDAGAKPDLTPYQPSGWSDKIVASTVIGTNTDSTTITENDTIYIDWAIINSGNADCQAYNASLYIDDIFWQSWSLDALNIDWYQPLSDYDIGSLSAGTHTLRLVVDGDNDIAESDETNNSYTKIITVDASAPKPDLTPYKRNDWSDKIVASTVTGTNTDSTTITENDTIYIDWVIINSGNVDSEAYNASLYIDDILEKSWSLVALNSGWSQPLYDYNIGSLSDGTHTLQLVVDGDNDIAESDETNNSYTKIISIDSNDAGNSYTTATLIDISNQYSNPDYVGLGDAYDYYKFIPDGNGEFDFSLTGLSTKIKGSVVHYDATKGKYKRIASLKTDKKTGLTATNNLLLRDGETYYAVIASADKGKGKYNTDYTLDITPDYFPTATNDNSWQTAQALTDVPVDGWVGFGDNSDWYQFDLAAAGAVELELSELQSDANMFLYYYDNTKNKLKCIIKAKSKGTTDEFISGMGSADTYYVEVIPGKKVNSASYNLDLDITYGA